MQVISEFCCKSKEFSNFKVSLSQKHIERMSKHWETNFCTREIILKQLLVASDWVISAQAYIDFDFGV